MAIRVHRGGGKGAPSLFSGPGLVFRNVWEHSTLTRHMVKKDIKLAYHGTFLGYLWTLLEPLLLTLILYALFVILRGTSDEYLPLKVMLGILFYGCFSKTMAMCTNALIANSSLINQVYFPKEKISELINGGATVVMVSHNISIIKELCNQAFYIKKGQICSSGDVDDACAKYNDF